MDMEGVAGIVDETQWLIGEANYQRSRDLMINECNAAIEGALAAGADEIIVNDSHHHMINLDPAKMHPAAKLIIGRIKTMSMCEGLGEGFDAAMFVGYHAGRGAKRSCLDHTYTGILHSVIVNGKPANEAVINGLVAGHFGCPLVMVAGDQVLRKEMGVWNPTIQCCVVKESLGRQSVKSIHPEKSCELIREWAERAIQMRADIPPLTTEMPVTLEVEFENAQMGDMVERAPFVERIGARLVRIKATDAILMFRQFLTIMTMASAVR